MANRSIREIAGEVRKVWEQPYFGAVPYIEAMLQLDTINDEYGADSAQMIVLYFLSNASYWRGSDARRIKTELRNLLKDAR
jgi:hypothetical protein